MTPAGRRRRRRPGRAVGRVPPGRAGRRRRRHRARRRARGAGPGGSRRGGFRFDTGPTVLTMPDLLADTFAAAGADMDDFVTLRRLDPAYRAVLRRRLRAARAGRPRRHGRGDRARSAGRPRPPPSSATATGCDALYRVELRDVHRPQLRLPARSASGRWRRPCGCSRLGGARAGSTAWCGRAFERRAPAAALQLPGPVRRPRAVAGARHATP